MSIRSTLIARAFFASTLSAIPALAIAEPGDMMHLVINTDTQVTGSPGAPQIIVKKDVCLSKDHDPRTLARVSQRDMDCAFSNYKQVFDQDGNSTRFQETCSGPTHGNATFTMELGGVHGQMHLDGKMNGKTVSVDTTIDGAVTGSCDYKPPHTAH